jgi:hypothetical protein
MEGKKRSKGICVIMCEGGEESFPNMTRGDCTEKAKLCGCSCSWRSSSES